MTDPWGRNTPRDGEPDTPDLRSDGHDYAMWDAAYVLGALSDRVDSAVARLALTNETAAHEFDARVGGRYAIIGYTADDTHHVSGVYREVAPNEKLVFTWAWRTMPERESLVPITFVVIYLVSVQVA